MRLSNSYNINLTSIDITAAITFNPTAFIHPTVGTFSHAEFWAAFQKEHGATTVEALMTLLADVSRCHFSPKITNWPGLTLAITTTDPQGIAAVAAVPAAGSGSGIAAAPARPGPRVYTIVLEAGKSVVKPFTRGKGPGLSWTHYCLATSTLFHQIYHANAEGIAACNRIPGHYAGYTQFMSTCLDWLEANQTQVEAAFTAWANAAGLKARDPAVDVKVKAAARKTITDRTPDNCALSFKNALLLLTGDDTDQTHNIVVDFSTI
jgi:hypothetical protein